MSDTNRYPMGAVIVLGLLALGLSAANGQDAANGRLADLAEAADWEGVDAAVDDLADVNATQPDGTSALMWASYHANSDAVRRLLEAGATPDALNRYGVSAMSQAAVTGDAAVIELLLAAGADPNAAMPEGDTALMLAARSGRIDAVELLLEHGADVHARDDWHGETALMWAAGENHADIVRLLAEHGAEIDAVSTAFDWDFFTQVGVASQLPRGGLTALFHAARNNAYEAARVLLELGANPNATDPQGITILRVAITNDNLDLAKMLLEHGADADDGSLVEAVKLRTMDWVRAAKIRPDETDDFEMIDLLIARGADLHKVPQTGMVKQHWVDGEHPNEPPLFLAAMGGDLELMERLFESGAELEDSRNRNGATVLMAALDFTPHSPPGGGAKVREIEDAISAASLVVERGADIDATNDDGMTALHMAADKDKDELVRFLLDHGARLDLKDSSNRLPIDVAKGIPAVPKKGALPAPPGQEPKVHESTLALLREAMAAGGVEEEPYVAPPPDTDEGTRYGAEGGDQ